jgi:hypothetical protein
VKPTMTIIDDSMDYWLIALWSLYAIVTSVLIIRFARNIRKLTSRIKSNPAIDYKNSKLVLLKKILPHTFWILYSSTKQIIIIEKIEAELYTHELIHKPKTHARHSVYRNFKLLFWFNPVFIFYKKAIQLNHEFLADEKVVKSYNNVPFYQNLLLSVSNANSSYYLASNLNYSITKKINYDDKTTSTTRSMLKKLVLAPLFTGLVFLVCVKTVAQERKQKLKSIRQLRLLNREIF